jgi:hypothetical protein
MDILKAENVKLEANNEEFKTKINNLNKRCDENEINNTKGVNCLYNEYLNEKQSLLAFINDNKIT